MKFRNFGATLALAVNDFLGVALVDYIDKRSIFGLGYSTNRQSTMRGFQITTQRLDTTNAREDIKGNVNLNGLDGLEQWKWG